MYPHCAIRLAVYFRQPVGGRLLARSLLLESGPIRDARIGNLLGRAPRSLQAAIASVYGDEYELVRPYRLRWTGLWTGEFEARDSNLHITFGRTTPRGTFIGIWTT
jgi:hypothetical protein